MAETLHPVLAQKGIKPGTKEALFAVAQFYVDKKYTEQPKNSNNTVFGAWYGVQTSWCAMFVSYCLNKSGNGVTINGAQSKKGYALCSKGIKWFQKKKAWYPVMKAQPGDVAFFDWDHNNDPDHTGLILRVDTKKKKVLTIEGNTGHGNLSNGGAVMKQWRNMSSIIGVGRPAFPAATPAVAPVATAPVVTPAPTAVISPAPIAAPAPVTPAPVAVPAVAVTPAKKPTLKVGSKGNWVKALQKKLGVTADGAFGPKTQAALKAYQTKHGIPATGITDAKTWAKLG